MAITDWSVTPVFWQFSGNGKTANSPKADLRLSILCTEALRSMTNRIYEMDDETAWPVFFSDASKEWRRKLLDLTNRNQLVSCKIGPRAAIRLEHPSPGEVWSGLLGGADLTFAWKRELVPDANDSGDDNHERPSVTGRGVERGRRRGFRQSSHSLRLSRAKSDPKR